MNRINKILSYDHSILRAIIDASLNITYFIDLSKNMTQELCQAMKYPSKKLLEDSLIGIYWSKYKTIYLSHEQTDKNLLTSLIHEFAHHLLDIRGELTGGKLDINDEEFISEGIAILCTNDITEKRNTRSVLKRVYEWKEDREDREDKREERNKGNERKKQRLAYQQATDKTINLYIDILESNIDNSAEKMREN